MELKIQKYLYAIITSIHSIYDYLGENRDFNEYSENKLLRRAVERELEIIGEASNRILNDYICRLPTHNIYKTW